VNCNLGLSQELKDGPPEPFKLVENDSNCEMLRSVTIG
jgi:hypothetical protein